MTKNSNGTRGWEKLNRNITTCEQCERLTGYCRQVAVSKRKAYRESEYWGRPVPNFGDPSSALLIVGLAPAAHGANRTGRMFTGDRSGDFLFEVLHKVGLCNQPSSVDSSDGLMLNGCCITAICHCAPPANKPMPEELDNCRDWLESTIDQVPVRVFLALGQMAWKSILQVAVDRNWAENQKSKFGHGAHLELAHGRHLVGCYHPSQQNTFTGRLTQRMMISVFQKTLKLVDRH
ncbi:MAG: uracil-DNA glycosylase [Planctomycetota bacterium]|nr:uracil-DNA glycosylase [Planctomycetota bacterium]